MHGNSAQKVCFHLPLPAVQTVYEKLGHAEVVAVDLSAESIRAEKEFRKFADTYFKQFRKTENGMQRLVGGAAYRCVTVDTAYCNLVLLQCDMLLGSWLMHMRLLLG